MITQQIVLKDFSGQIIRQDNLTRMFSANDLANLFPNKNFEDWCNLSTTKKYVDCISMREGIENSEVFFRSGKKRGELRGTWVHPYLAIDLAMWLDVSFKYDIIRWIYDNLCDYGNSAGGNHRLMCDAIYEVLKPVDGFTYANETIMVQDLAGIPKGKRNMATDEQLASLSNLQKWNARLIRLGLTNIVTRRARLIEFEAMIKEEQEVK